VQPERDQPPSGRPRHAKPEEAQQPRPDLPPSRPRHAKQEAPSSASGVQSVAPSEREEMAASRADNASSGFWAGGNGVPPLSERFAQPTAGTARHMRRPTPSEPTPSIVDEGDFLAPSDA